MKKILLVALSLSGCTPYIDKSELHFRGVIRNQVPDLKQSKTINEVLDHNFSHEWEMVGKTTVPELGIALSGGGTRSASFSIGVLRALHENNILNDVDIISSVSGGSYAAYWYYAQHYYMDQVACDYPTYQYDRDSIFNTFDLSHPENCLNKDKYEHNVWCKERNRMGYRFQRHLEDRSDILVRSVAKHNQIIDYLEKTLLWIPSTAAHLATDFVFDWDINTNPLRQFYENGLERTYGYVPLDKIKKPMDRNILVNKNYVNDKRFIFKRVYAEPISFSELGTFIRAKKSDRKLRMPFWVINTTTSLSDRPHWLRGIVDNTHYSERLSDNVFEFTPLGYGSSSYGFVASPSETIDVSRAVAISGAAVDGQFGGSIAPLMYGLNLNLGYAIENYNTTKLQRVIHAALPFPFYFFHHPSQSANNQSIYLSDGGHSENLGLYSLIRRGVKKIIVVDAEYDPQGCFNALNILKKKIKDEDKLILKFETDDFENFTPMDTNVHLVKGKITGFPLKATNGQPYEIDIYYLKLSIDRQFIIAKCKDFGKYCTVKHQIGSQPKFPHHSTADIQYSKKQVAAYRELGYLLGKEITRNYLMLP